MSDKSVTLLHAVHDGVSFGMDVRHMLENRAYALDIVGMDRLAGDLRKIGDAVEKTFKIIQDAHSGRLSEDVHQSEELTGAMLKAILEGCIMAKENDNG